jgi:hypothetical protein
MTFNDNQKIQVLLAQLQERYSASHNMRERSTQFTLWISGMAIGLAWLLISHPGITLMQRIALTMLIVALFVGSFVFIRGLQKGFKNNRNAMIACERSLEMYEPGTYLEEGALLPAAYAEKQKRWSDHFNTLTIWLSIVTLALVILTWTCPQIHSSIQPCTQTFEEKEQ